MQIEFIKNGALVVFDHFDGAQTAAFSGDALQRSGGEVEPLNVLIDHFANRRAHYFDHHLGAVVQTRCMHLRNRGGGQGFIAEFGKHRFDALPQLLFNARAGLVSRERWHFILQEGQFQCDVVWHQVAAGRQDLTKFDEDRPQVFAGHA